LPVFRDPALSCAMICHAMNVFASATRCTHPGQVPVIILDQPLCSLASQFNGPGQLNVARIILKSCLVPCLLTWLS
jgi:hypothetical protein